MPGPGDLSRDELVALAVEQARQIGELQAENVALAERNTALAERVARLERMQSRNSGNSSMPPSGDDALGRKKPAAKPARSKGGKRGKRRGSPGAAVAPVADPDRRVPMFPETCRGCGGALDQAEHCDEDYLARQQIEIPLMCATVTEYQLHRVRCACGTVTTAPLPLGVADAPISYGPNVQALAVYLMVFHAVPVQRCCQLIADVTGAAPSPGFVHGMLARAAKPLAAFAKLVKTMITLAYVVHFDETTLRCGPCDVKRYVWTASTELLTAHHLGGRSGVEFTAFGVGADFHGVAVHDNYAVYDGRDAFGTGIRHQLCCAHLLRHLQDAAESHPGAHWPAQASRALRALIRSWHQAGAAGLADIPADVRAPLVTEFRRAVRVGLSDIPRTPDPNAKQLPARNLLECLRDREHDVLRFCSDTRVPPTNNLAERDLRPHKTQQKISGRLQSENVTRDRLTIRGYLSTAAKNSVDAMTALRGAVIGSPWMPPVPIRA